MEDTALFVTADKQHFSEWERHCKEEWLKKTSHELNCKRLSSIKDCVAVLHKGDPSRVKLIVVDVDCLPETRTARIPEDKRKPDEQKHLRGLEVAFLNLQTAGPGHEVLMAGTHPCQAYTLVVGSLFSDREAISKFLPRGRIIFVKNTKQEAQALMRRYLGFRVSEPG